MYKALVIGCGNIGAMYDFDADEIQTHVKALVKNGNFDVTVFDVNRNLAEKVANKYQIRSIEKLDDISEYDLVSICSPTKTHVRYLEMCLDAETKLVICEKPISYDLSELETIEKKGKTRILVNYIRPFLPAYKELKKEIVAILEIDDLTGIVVKYYKGLINYASHAMDLLEFLFDRVISFSRFQIAEKHYDFFEDDPTISGFGYWNEVPLNVIGLTRNQYAVFEVEIYFRKHSIFIRANGKKIEIYRIDKSTMMLADYPVKTYENCLKDYMKYVIMRAEFMLKDESLEDNFEKAKSINKTLLNLIRL